MKIVGSSGQVLSYYYFTKYYVKKVCLVRVNDTPTSLPTHKYLHLPGEDPRCRVVERRFSKGNSLFDSMSRLPKIHKVDKSSSGTQYLRK